MTEIYFPAVYQRPEEQHQGEGEQTDGRVQVVNQHNRYVHRPLGHLQGDEAQASHVYLQPQYQYVKDIKISRYQEHRIFASEQKRVSGVLSI